MRASTMSRTGLRDGADADEHLHGLRDDGRHRAAVDGADRDDGRIMRIDIARHDRLQCHHEAGRRDDRIDRLVRNGAVAANALDDDGGDVDRRRDRAGLARGSGLPASPGRLWSAKTASQGKRREQTVLDHPHRTALVLLRGLEDQVHGAVEIPRFGEIAREPQQHRGVAVMAAGMHLAGIFRGIGKVRLLLDRQRIHVGADADGAARRAVAEGADDARPGDAASSP